MGKGDDGMLMKLLLSSEGGMGRKVEGGQGSMEIGGTEGSWRGGLNLGENGFPRSSVGSPKLL